MSAAGMTSATPFGLPLMSLPVAAGAGGVVIVAVLATTLLLLRQIERGRRLQLRLAEGVVPLAPARSPDQAAAGRPGGRLWAAWRERLTRLIGVDLNRLDAYPWRWPVLFLLAVGPGFAATRLAGHVFGYDLDLLLPGFWILASRMLFSMLHARHATKLYQQFPDVLSMIVRSVRAGIPLAESLRMVARESLEPTARQFTRVCDQIAIGLRLDDALREAAARTGVPEYAFFTVALSLQSQTGGSLAETLDNLAEVIRKRVALRSRAVALASEARTSAYVLAALPIVTGLALTVLHYEYMQPLFETRGGNQILYGAIGLLLTGGGVMRTMIKSSLK